MYFFFGGGRGGGGFQPQSRWNTSSEVVGGEQCINQQSQTHYYPFWHQWPSLNNLESATAAATQRRRMVQQKNMVSSASPQSWHNPQSPMSMAIGWYITVCKRLSQSVVHSLQTLPKENSNEAKTKILAFLSFFIYFFGWRQHFLPKIDSTKPVGAYPFLCVTLISIQTQSPPPLSLSLCTIQILPFSPFLFWWQHCSFVEIQQTQLIFFSFTTLTVPLFWCLVWSSYRLPPLPPLLPLPLSMQICAIQGMPLPGALPASCGGFFALVVSLHTLLITLEILA